MSPIPLGILAASGGGDTSGIAGYFMGGSLSSGVTSAVDKFTFASESRSSLGTGISTVGSVGTGFANRGVAGYAAAFYDTAYRTTVDKFSMTNDSRTTLGTGLSIARTTSNSYANDEVAGYVSGGEINGFNVNTNSINKFAFPSDTRSNLSATVSTANALASGGMQNTGVAGYAQLGHTASGAVATVDKLSFTAETNSALGTGLSQARAYSGTMSDDGVAGYVAGGRNFTTNYTTVDKFAFPSDTRSTLGTGLALDRWGHAGLSKNNSAGYIGGGAANPSTARTDIIQKFAFPSDTRTTIGAVLSAPNLYLGSFSN